MYVSIQQVTVNFINIFFSRNKSPINDFISSYYNCYVKCIQINCNSCYLQSEATIRAIQYIPLFILDDVTSFYDVSFQDKTKRL